MNVEYLETEPELLVEKEYGIDNVDLKVEDLTEVFVLVYTYKKKGVKEVQEVYTFTTDFEQALKRFKLLPHSKCLLKRFLTDSEALIKLGVDGTKDKLTEECLEGLPKEVDFKELLDQFRDEDDDGNVIKDNGFTVTELDESKLKDMLSTHECKQVSGEPNITIPERGWLERYQNGVPRNIHDDEYYESDSIRYFKAFDDNSSDDSMEEVIKSIKKIHKVPKEIITKEE